MQNVIQEWFQGATIISIAHRVDTLLYFDRVIVMDHGLVVEDDNPRALLERDSRFKRLHELNRENRQGNEQQEDEKREAPI
jgi:ATP-binding cassette, subfamily C (CFTR/MRP), member 1